MIDDGNQTPWPDEVRQAVQGFKQGDVLEHPPFFYAADFRYPVWGLTRRVGDGTEESPVVELDPASRVAPPYGIITTQTCDLDEQATQPKQPWIQVAPVSLLDHVAGDQWAHIEGRRIGHLVALTGPEFASGRWAADLRIQVPLEKGLLVGRSPIAGFHNEDGYLAFSEHLARRVGRPALADVLIKAVVTPLQNQMKKLRGERKRAIAEHVLELRLETDPSRLQPKSARLLILVKQKPPPPEVQDWFDQWWETLQHVTDAQDTALLANRFLLRGELSSLHYRRSAELDFRYLSPLEER